MKSGHRRDEYELKPSIYSWATGKRETQARRLDVVKHYLLYSVTKEQFNRQNGEK